MPEIAYPIFLVDRDHIVLLIKDANHLNYHLERIDIEDGEYDGWDVKARPIELFLDGSDIRARLADEQACPTELKAAIFRYANRGKRPFIYQGPSDDYLNLLQAAEAHVAAQGFLSRVKHWLSGK